MKVAISVNGTRGRGGGRGPAAARALRARGGRLDRYEHRLRHDLLRRVHRAAGRGVGEVLHGARRPGGRAARSPPAKGWPAPDGRWHAVQQGFHAEHGLQCGFCTPGMMMAAVSLLAENPDPTEEQVRTGLEGQPLPVHRLSQHRPGGARRGPGRPARRPAGRQSHDPGTVRLPAGRAPSRRRSSLAADAGEDGKYLAGGHSLLPLMKLRFAVPEVLIDIGRIRDLSYIRDEGDAHRDRRADPAPRSGVLRAARRRAAAARARRRVRRRPADAAPGHDRRVARAR